jgi:hypothetical protein
LLTIVLLPLVWIALIGVFWLQSRVPEWVYWKTGLIFLIATEIAYGVSVALAVAGTFGLGFLFYRRRGRTRERPAVARGRLLCVSLLCGVAAAEAVCAAWLSRSVIDPFVCAVHFGIDRHCWETICSWEEWFNNLVAPLRHDPTRRLQARDAARAAADQIAAGVAPEAVGLPNVGTPAPVLVLPVADAKPSRAPAPVSEVSACLGTFLDP